MYSQVEMFRSTLFGTHRLIWGRAADVPLMYLCCGLTLITPISVSEYTFILANGRSFTVQQVDIHKPGDSIMFWEPFSGASLGPVIVVKQTLNATEYLNIIADQLHSYNGVCLLNWKWNVPVGQRSVSQGSIYIGVVPGL